MKILHLPSDVGGNAWGLSRGERSLGFDSDVLVKDSGKFDYPADIALNLGEASFIKKGAVLLKTFFDIRNRYDLFHFNFGSSLLHSLRHPLLTHLDLPFYPKGKTLIATYNGCDARQKFPTMKCKAIAACHNSSCYGGMCNSGQRDISRQAAIEKMSQYASHIFAVNPDLLRFLPPNQSSFLPYTIAKIPEMARKPRTKTLKIVHAPTNRAAKGTELVLKACESLKTRYPKAFDLVLIEGMTHQNALKAYCDADLVIDQLLIGWYGAFAVECLFMGKPVMAYIDEKELHHIPAEMKKNLLDTVINVTPYTLEKRLEEILMAPEKLDLIGDASLAYAYQWHFPEKIAKGVVEKYLQLRKP